MHMREGEYGIVTLYSNSSLLAIECLDKYPIMSKCVFTAAQALQIVLDVSCN